MPLNLLRFIDIICKLTCYISRIIRMHGLDHHNHQLQWQASIYKQGILLKNNLSLPYFHELKGGRLYIVCLKALGLL